MPETSNDSFLHWQDLSELNNELVGLICYVRELKAQIETDDLTGAQLKASFAVSNLRILIQSRIPNSTGHIASIT